MQTRSTDLTVRAILRYMKIASETIGSQWLKRKIREEHSRRIQASLSGDSRKHSYLYRPNPHPLVDWAIEADQWRQKCLKTHRVELSQAILKFGILGRALERTRGQNGFSRIINRLKQPDQFDAAAFEVEVASSYLAAGSAVDFVEEGDERSPDLRVTTFDGTVLWVECKCRDRLTERDKRIGAFWKELESSLLRFVGPKKLNFAIFVQSLVDPELSMVLGLKDFIIQAIEKGGIGTIDNTNHGFRAERDPTGRFLVAAQLLAEPDKVINTSSIGIRSSEQLDRVIVVAESMVDKAGNNFFRNPVSIAFKNALPADKVTGILHGLKSAVGQLPEQGPGVVWIRVPDNAWVNDLEPSFKQAQTLLKTELSGSHNQRVNAVILMTRVFEELHEGENTGLGYKPIVMTIEHSNPRCTLHKQSPVASSE